MGFEFYSEYLYRSMAAYCYSQNYKGFGTWLETQASEEHSHAMKIFHYLIERGEKVEISEIKQPPVTFKSVLHLFEMVYDHEKNHVTAGIHKLYKMSLDENDYPTQIFLQWFVNEQVEEEANSLEILEKLKMIGDKASGIFMLDHQYGKRKAN